MTRATRHRVRRSGISTITAYQCQNIIWYLPIRSRIIRQLQAARRARIAGHGEIGHCVICTHPLSLFVDVQTCI